jgi:hypothetical protein
MLAPRYRFENAELFGAATGSAARAALVASISPDAAMTASRGSRTFRVKTSAFSMAMR